MKEKGWQLTYHFEGMCKRIALNSNSDKIIVEKSTAPLGTAKKIKEILKTKGLAINFEVISNPEFLAEGTAIDDLINPDRVLIGGEESENGEKAIKVISIYIQTLD